MKDLMIFDTHAHYDDEKFDEDRDTLIKGLKDNNIGFVVNVGASMQSCKKTVSLSAEYDNILAAIGVHPSDTAPLNEEFIEWMKNEALSNRRVVAIGEIGLDYYWDEPDRQVQKKWFARQIQLAKEVNLPIIVHSREAAKDTFDIMKAEKAEETGGVIHCYSYTKEMARQYLDMGYFFGIGGVVTFKNARKLVEAVEYIPIDSIVLETDCPYLSPEPNRGKRNSSLNLKYVAEKIAQIKNLDYDEVVRITTENAKRLYKRGEEFFG